MVYPRPAKVYPEDRDRGRRHDPTRRDDEPCGAPWGGVWIIATLVACVAAAKLGAWLA